MSKSANLGAFSLGKTVQFASAFLRGLNSEESFAETIIHAQILLATIILLNLFNLLT